MSLCRSREQTYQKRNTYLSNEWKFLDLDIKMKENKASSVPVKPSCITSNYFISEIIRRNKLV